MKRVAFLHNVSGVGGTTVTYHVAHMMVEMGNRVLLVDLDPQASLTAMCLSEERLEALWPSAQRHEQTLLGWIQPVFERGAARSGGPHVEDVCDRLAIVPGDIGLSSVDEGLLNAWMRAQGQDKGAFHALSALNNGVSLAMMRHAADVALFDMGPSLGAICRTAIASMDGIVTPLAPDLFSTRGLGVLGSVLEDWQHGWQERIARNGGALDGLASGRALPLGYVVLQDAMRLSRPVSTFARWMSGLPREYHRSVLRDGLSPASPAEDPACLGILRHYRSLIPLARDARKPMFDLRPADGAIGSHMQAVARCREDFHALAQAILDRMDAHGTKNG
ncbi:MAG: AAA family ATPase [Polyangiaceae bacterium]